MLSQETQLLLSLLSDLGDDGVEQTELLALLVHLIVWVFEHHLETIIAQQCGKSLKVREVEGLSFISFFSCLKKGKHSYTNHIYGLTTKDMKCSLNFVRHGVVAKTNLKS